LLSAGRQNGPGLALPSARLGPCLVT